jgi:nucleotide-binding universal stress UspA family protein
MRMVVGVDGSADARDALRWALANALPDARVEVVHAWEVPLMGGYDAALAMDPTEIETAAQSFVDELVAEIDDPRVVPILARGGAGVALVELAEQAPGADLVVVGHRGDGKMALLGSVASHVAHHCHRPVAVVRGDRIGRAARLVVGVDDHRLDDDGENASVRALRWAFGHPGVEEIDVLHAWFVPAMAAGRFSGPGADLEEQDAAAASVVQRVLDATGPPPTGVTIREVAERGTPGFALVEASRNADLVVVGARRRGGLVGLVLGSTCNDVLADSHAPVVVIH